VLDRLEKERAAAIADNRPVPLIPRGRPKAFRPVSINDGNDAWTVHDSDEDDDVILKSPLLGACSAGGAQGLVPEDSADVRALERSKDDDPGSSSTTTKDSDDTGKA
jgi:hypothetical protein